MYSSLFQIAKNKDTEIHMYFSIVKKSAYLGIPVNQYNLYSLVDFHSSGRNRGNDDFSLDDRVHMIYCSHSMRSILSTWLKIDEFISIDD